MPSHALLTAAATAALFLLLVVFFLLRRQRRARQALEREPLLKAAKLEEADALANLRQDQAERAERAEALRIEAVAEQAALLASAQAETRRAEEEERRRQAEATAAAEATAGAPRAIRTAHPAHTRTLTRRARRRSAATTVCESARVAPAEQRARRPGRRRRGRARNSRSTAGMKISMIQSHTRESPRRARAPLPSVVLLSAATPRAPPGAARSLDLVWRRGRRQAVHQLKRAHAAKRWMPRCRLARRSSPIPGASRSSSSRWLSSSSP